MPAPGTTRPNESGKAMPASWEIRENLTVPDRTNLDCFKLVHIKNHLYPFLMIFISIFNHPPTHQLIDEVMPV